MLFDYDDVYNFSFFSPEVFFFLFRHSCQWSKTCCLGLFCCSGLQPEVAMKMEFDGEEENALESVPPAKKARAGAKEKGEDYCRVILDQGSATRMQPVGK